MWYAILTGIGKEEGMRLACRQKLGRDMFSRCVIPVYEEKIRYQGQWHIQKEKLFPGYLFLSWDNSADALYTLLQKVRSKLEREYLIPLTPDETDFLLRLIGNGEVARLSQGIIVGGTTMILQGPLMRMESSIQKIDRHKRKAWISTQMFGKPRIVEIGVEIIRKAAS